MWFVRENYNGVNIETDGNFYRREGRMENFDRVEHARSWVDAEKSARIAREAAIKRFPDRPLKVSELIAQLQEMPLDAAVFTEGCDCDGTASGVELQKDGTVMIRRPA